MTDRELMQQAFEAMLNFPDDISDEMFESIKALRKRLAQPEQKPVAWMHNDIEGNVITHRPADLDRHPERWTPLYTAPPQRKPLTDEVIWLEYQRFWPFHPAEEPTLAKEIVKFARAIEAKLKEKNT